jgi:hypothetical protein
MSQNSLVLPTTGTVSGLAMTQNTNNALDTLNTLASGASQPASSEAGQWWHNTSANTLNIRNLANNAWIQIATLDETNNIWMPPIGGNAASSIATTSSGLCDLWSTPQGYLTVTGTFSTSSLCGASSGVVGTMKTVVFAAAVPLVYSSSQLILPSVSSFTTAAGDTAEVVNLGSGNVRVTNYTLANGRALVATSPSIATSSVAGIVKPDGSTITVTSSGGISAAPQLMTPLGVGSIIFANATSAAPIAAGSTTAASNLSCLAVDASTFVNSGDSLSGTWKTLQSINANGANSGMLQRVA